MLKYVITAVFAFGFLNIISQNNKVYYAEDFDQAKWNHTIGDSNLCIVENLPAGWQVYDSLELDYYWHWSDVGPRGHFINPTNPLQPSSLMLDDDFWTMENSITNGFMMLESDFFNTDSLGFMKLFSYRMSSYIQYGPVDLSQATHPVIAFNSFLRVCCDPDKGKMQLLISTDYNADNPEMATWLPYNLEFLHSNYYSDRVQFNISSQTAGESNVYFRWKQVNLSHYFWMLDDIEVYEAPQNDLALLDHWIDYNEVVNENNYPYGLSMSNNGGYTRIPEFSARSFKEVRAAVKNNGSQTQNVVLSSRLIKDGVEINSSKSDGLSIDFFESDTIRLPIEFELTGIGNYQVSNTVSGANADEYYANNDMGYSFEVTDNVYSRVYKENDVDYVTSGNWKYRFGGVESGEIYTQKFEFFGTIENVLFKQMRFFLPSFKGLISELRALQNGNISVVARIFKPDSENKYLPVLPAVISSEEYQLSIDDTVSWISLDFVDEGDNFVNEGTYFVGVEVYIGPSEADIQFGIGVDEMAPSQMFGEGQKYSPGNGNWSYSTENYAIELITESKLNNIVSDQTDLAFYPNPVKDVLNISDAHEIKHLRLYTIDGKLITDWHNVSSSINVSKLNQGIYVLVVEKYTGEKASTKLIRQ